VVEQHHVAARMSEEDAGELVVAGVGEVVLDDVEFHACSHPGCRVDNHTGPSPRPETSVLDVACCAVDGTVNIAPTQRVDDVELERPEERRFGTVVVDQSCEALLAVGAGTPVFEAHIGVVGAAGEGCQPFGDSIAP